MRAKATKEVGIGADLERDPASFTVLDSWILSEMIKFRGPVL